VSFFMLTNYKTTARWLLVSACSAIVLPVMAQQSGTAVSAATLASTLIAPSATSTDASPSLQELVRKPLVLRGTLGNDQIQVRVQPKVNEDGLEGKYFIFGQSAQVLLAGEVDQNELIMEESYNGKDVSGDWQGTFKDGVLSGTWSSLDGSVNKQFTLKITAP